MEDPYAFPGSSLLRNRLGIVPQTLDAATQLAFEEALRTGVRLAELAARPIAGHYDLDHLQAIHRHVFSDVYAWAGEIRTVAITKEQRFSLCPNSLRGRPLNCSLG